jgi:biopolymer transport protein ExbD
MQFARKKRRQPIINIISMIDILVVLLIFYIATTQAKSTTEAVPSTIYVSSDSKIFFDDAPIEADKLGDLLKSKMDANPQFKVAMKADKNAPFAIIVKVMDAANYAHIANLSTYMDAKPAAAP